MTDYKENRRLFSLKGFLNRRDFIANVLIINAITTAIFIMPLLLFFVFSPDSLFNLLGFGPLNITLALSIVVWVFLYAITGAVLYFPNVFRRITDILGENKKIPAYVITSCIIVYLFIVNFLADEYFKIFQWISLFIILSLMCLKGQISSKEPKDEIAKFNWGAFLGTWIWGICNKSYKSLWALLLWLTPAGLNYAIACGIKGNAWAYKKSENTDIEEFHKKQKFQTKIWLCVAPVLAVVMFFTFVVSAGLFGKYYVKKHPDFVVKMDSYVAQLDIKQAESIFSQIENKNGEYKFYIAPQTWKQTSGRTKSKIINIAAVYVIRTDKNLAKSKDKDNIPIEKLQKVKIYSSFNNELLGEFEFASDDKFTKAEIRNIKNKHKINEHPSLP